MSDINLDNNLDNNTEKNVEEQDISALCEAREENNVSNEIDKKSETVPTKKTKDFFRSLLEQIELIVVALAVIILIFTFVGRTCRVSGESMENTLHHNELIITTNLFYTPDRGDIVVFHQTGNTYNEPIVKRIIGLPGDTVKIEYFQKSMKVTVIYPDGTSDVLDEDYIKYEYQTYQNMTVKVEENTVFAMGDNRSHSADSRSPAIGLIDQRRILGKAIWRITPLDSFGKIE